MPVVSDVENAPDMGTAGADPASGQVADPSTGRLSTADQGIYNASPPGAQTDINDILGPYIKELMNLGPEYGAEMEYLKPYLMPQQETFQQVEQQSKAQETPTGNAAVNQADEQLGKALEGEQAPGFGNLGKAAEDFANTVPYSQLLQTVLGAGKNEILYGTVPNISNISTKGWPESLQQAYSFLTQAATGTNAKTGLNAPGVAAAAGQPVSYKPGSSSVQGGGNG